MHDGTTKTISIVSPCLRGNKGLTAYDPQWSYLVVLVPSPQGSLIFWLLPVGKTIIFSSWSHSGNPTIRPQHFVYASSLAPA